MKLAVYVAAFLADDGFYSPHIGTIEAIFFGVCGGPLKHAVYPDPKQERRSPMSPAEQASEKEKYFDDQVPHLPGALNLSERARTNWLCLSECLITAYQQCLDCVQPHLEEVARAEAAQATVETTLQGNAAALALIDATAAEGDSQPLLGRKYPWAELGRAYAAAFTAAGMVALQVAAGPLRMTALAGELARLALRAAKTLAHGVGLLLGTRQSGSIGQISAYVGTLESQADTLLRGFLAAPPQKRRNGGQQTDAERDSVDRQVLLALEAMTDRCEDIADALLAVAHNHYEEWHPTSAISGLGETHE